MARVRIPDRVSIHDRPTVIDKRNEVGHWEGDSVLVKTTTQDFTQNMKE